MDNIGSLPHPKEVHKLIKARGEDRERESDREMGEQSSFAMSYQKIKPYLAMVSLQCGFAGMYIITLVSLNQGMSHYVLAVYRHAVATLAMAPFALVLERKVRPKMTASIALKITALGLIEPVIDQNLYYLGMKYTSATLASATANILPALTFILAVIFRQELIKIRKIHTQAKIVGSAVTIIGTVVMVLYKGPVVDFLSSQGASHHAAATSRSGAADKHWLPGTLMLLARCFGWAAFLVLQSFTLKEYPAELSLTSLICLMGTVQGAAVAFVMERGASVWAIGWDSRLLAAVYSGVVCSGIAYYAQGVVMKERGPVFVAAFSPLCMLITAAFGIIILAEQVFLGSVIGAGIIVVGLYSVVWGKSKDPIRSQFEEDDSGFELPIAVVNNSSSSREEGMEKVPVQNPQQQKQHPEAAPRSLV